MPDITPTVRSAISPVALLTPTATTGLCALISLQPVDLPVHPFGGPSFALMAVFHWTIYRPNILPPLALFIIGLINDLLTGNRLGMTSLLFLVSRVAVLWCRRWFFDRSFLFVWAGFAALTIAAAVGEWVTETVLTLHADGPSGMVFQAALTISIFPLASWLLGRTQCALID
jgi:rod shape-determining protein MreD